MSKKSYDEIENGNKSDCSTASSSDSGFDKRKKTNITFSESEKSKFTATGYFQNHENGNKIEKVIPNEVTIVPSTSGTSLDEELYGTSDKYCTTLQQIKRKLHGLNLNKPTSSLVTPQNEMDVKKTLFCNSTVNLKKNDYLFDKETSTSKVSLDKKIINQLDPNKSGDTKLSNNSEKNVSKQILATNPVFIQLTSNNNAQLTSGFYSNEFETIMKPVQMCSSSTLISSDIHQENICRNSFFKQSTTTLKNKVTKDYACTGLQICSSTIDSDKFSNKSSLQQSTSNTKKFMHNLGKTKRSSNVYSPQDICLKVDLPSSVDSDCTSSEKYNLKPVITTIESNKKPKRLYKKRNRIVPVYQSRSSSNTSLFDNKKELNKLVLKYYKDTPVISSNSCSTPPPDISTCASGSSTGTTLRSKTNSLDHTKNWSVVATRSSTVYSAEPVYKSIKAFNPIYSSSLDVPRKFSGFFDFPAISKITSFIHYPEVELYVINNVENSSTNVFSSLSKKIKDEIYTSTTSFKEKKHKVFSNVREDIYKTVDNPNLNNTDIKFRSTQKDSRELSFYTISSTDSKNDESDKIDKFDFETMFYTEEEQNSKCTSCFCNWMFPKRHNRLL